MATKKDIDEFLGSTIVAVVGLSRDPAAFSSLAFRELSAKGYTPFGVNPNAKDLAGCYPDFASLPKKAEAAIFFTPKSATETAIKAALDAGIKKLWIQQGADSEGALRFCRENAPNAVTGHCILMFLEPVKSVHSFHRAIKGFFGGIPK